MPQLITNPRTSERIENLQNEVQNLRSLVIGLVGRDREGAYRPDFVKKILKAAKQKAEYVFESKDSFLKRL